MATQEEIDGNSQSQKDQYRHTAQGGDVSPYFLEPERTQRVIVDLAPEGSEQAMPLILDTGAQGSVMTPGLARDLGIRVRRAKSTPYRRETRLGRDLQFWVDTRSTDTSAAFEYGLLGGQFLSRYVVEIDYDVQEVRVLDPDRYGVPAATSASGESVLPVRLVAHRPFVEVGLGDRAHRVLLDTGNPWTMDLREDTVRELGLVPRPLEGLRARGVPGPLRTDLAVLPELALGEHRLRGVPILSLRGDYNLRGATGASLGHDVLSQFVVRIDYPRRRLWLRRIEGRPLSFLGAHVGLLRRVGAMVRPVGESFDVEAVAAGSAASQLGLRPGHRIPADGEGTPDAEALAERIERGGPLRVLRRSGGSWEEERLSAPHTPGAGAPATDGDRATPAS